MRDTPTERVLGQYTGRASRHEYVAMGCCWCDAKCLLVDMRGNVAQNVGVRCSIWFVPPSVAERAPDRDARFLIENCADRPAICRKRTAPHKQQQH